MYRDDHGEQSPLYLFKPASDTGWPGRNSEYLEPYLAGTNIFICPSDRTRGRIPIVLDWEHFDKHGSFSGSYAYHIGPYQQLDATGK